MLRLRSRGVGYETHSVGHYLASVLLLFVFDVFRYSAEATWMANILINSERRSVLELTSLAPFSKNRFSLGHEPKWRLFGGIFHDSKNS